MELETHTCVKDGHLVESPSHGRPGRSLTQEDDDAGEDGDQRPGAQAGVQDVGFRVAGQQRPVRVTPTDLDGEGVGAAHGRDPAVTDHDGQEVQILPLPAEPSTPGVHARGIICGKGREGALGEQGQGGLRSAWLIWACSSHHQGQRPESPHSSSHLDVYRSRCHLAWQRSLSFVPSGNKIQKLALSYFVNMNAFSGWVRTPFSVWVFVLFLKYKDLWASSTPSVSEGYN